MSLRPRRSALLAAVSLALTSLVLSGIVGTSAASAAGAPGTPSWAATLHQNAAQRAAAVAAAQKLVPTTQGARVAHLCAQRVQPGRVTCMAEVRADLAGLTPAASAATPPKGYGPAQLQAAYAIPATPAGPSNPTVAIVDAYYSPAAEADLAVYRAQYNLPPCGSTGGCFQQISQTGGSPASYPQDAGWAGETALDLAMVSAVCPQCHILLVESYDETDTNLFQAVAEATTFMPSAGTPARYVSMSWGGGEDASETSIDASLFQQGAAQGIVYTAATGDYGYYYNSAADNSASYPATSPYVVAVGGTSLTPTTTSSRNYGEAAWRGAGSGCSTVIPRPAWNATSCGAKRGTSDISAVADPNTGVAVYQSSGPYKGWQVAGGTSASAPIIAAAYAVADGTATNSNPLGHLYNSTQYLNDVTLGSNGSCRSALICTAHAGWDGPTGLGTPNGIGAVVPDGTAVAPLPNRVVIAGVANQLGNVGKTVSLPMRSSDSAGAAVTYSVTGGALPPGTVLNPQTGLISGRLQTAGTYRVTVTVADPSGQSAYVTFTWSVYGPCSGQLFTNPSFSSGAAAWSATPNVISTRLAAARTGHAGAKLDGYGRTHRDILQRRVVITRNCHATLSYYLKVTSSDTSRAVHDLLTVSASTSTVGRYSNLNRSPRYALVHVDLSRFNGQAINLRWLATENNGYATSFLVDDVTVTQS